ncbi:hypothetical protein CHS0354_021771 [Potamilus streckersoni]|uniref:Uncharacterized protein n=1 Tax=Potamilus streckersoni TaxID=2493646 RepID=A0AAE0VPY6_9BIVA|nr:hypothetical protein CHS0354_021771 [Potamilus streckersoni]
MANGCSWHDLEAKLMFFLHGAKKREAVAVTGRRSRYFSYEGKSHQGSHEGQWVEDIPIIMFLTKQREKLMECPVFSENPLQDASVLSLLMELNTLGEECAFLPSLCH